MKFSSFMHEMRNSVTQFSRNAIEVTFEGDRAYTDGKRINLPSLGMETELNPAQVRALRGYVDHESGHIRHSNMPRIISFYDKCTHNGKEDLKNLHNYLEDVWMENAVMDDFIGSRKNLAQIGLLGNLTVRNGMKKAGITDYSEMFNIKDIESVGWVLKSMHRQEFVGDDCDEFVNSVPEEYKGLMNKFFEETKACKTSEEAITLAKSIAKLLKEEDEESLAKMDPEDFDPKAGGEGEEDEGSNSPEFNKGQAEEGKQTGKSRGTGKDGRPVKGKQDASEETQAMHSEESGNGASGAIGGHGESLAGNYKVASTADDIEYHRGMKAPEGGESTRYKVVNSTDYSKYHKIRDSVGPAIKQMSSKLKRAILARQQRDWDRRLEEGKLDSKALVRGYQLKPDIYKKRIDREEHDTVITLLVDLSGSMHGDKSRVATECVVAVSECLEGAGIHFNVVGFSNDRGVNNRPSGRFHRVERLSTVFFKDFNTPLRTARASIAQVEACVGGNNTDYDFISNAIEDLVKHPAPRKILLTFSDGSPASGGQGTYSELINLCNKMVKSGEKRGVECVGVGIKDDSVTKIYPKSVVVESVQDLSSTVFRQLTDLLVKEVKKR